MIDPFGRHVTYLRVSVTDRCDLRCVYCMDGDMTFLPRQELLTLEEIFRLCRVFVRKGVKRIRLTGGEPLVRRNLMQLVSDLGGLIGPDGLGELTMTTNGVQLEKHAEALFRAGVRRLNVSVDSLRPDRFRDITRKGDLARVLAGIRAAQAAGLAIKINMVAIRDVNEDEFDDFILWCGTGGLDLTLIEGMPMGEVAISRADSYLPLSLVRARLERRWSLEDIAERTGGPARYVRIRETGRKLGFITPLSHNFCESCNRVRLTCQGVLYMCLGQEDSVDLRRVLREHPDDDQPLSAAIDAAIRAKPRGHDFVIDRRNDRPSVGRHMSVTGG